MLCKGILWFRTVKFFAVNKLFPSVNCDVRHSFLVSKKESEYEVHIDDSGTRIAFVVEKDLLHCEKSSYSRSQTTGLPANFHICANHKRDDGATALPARRGRAVCCTKRKVSVPGDSLDTWPRRRRACSTQVVYTERTRRKARC